MGIWWAVISIPTRGSFFVPFIVMTAFTVLNLFIGITVDAMQSQHEAELDQQGADDRAVILRELRALREEVAGIRRGG